MANEISLSVGFSASKGGVTVRAPSGGITRNMAGTEMISNVQSVGTSAEALQLGDVTTIGYLVVKNLDATNFVEIDSANTFDKFPQKLLAGDQVVLRPQTATIHVKANTAAVDIAVTAVEL